MKLYHFLFKLMMKKNKINYLVCIGSIIIFIVIMTAFAIIGEYMKTDSMNSLSSFMFIRLKFSGIQTIFCITGVISILNQYYKIMRTNIIDYNILKALGVSKNQIRILIFLQALLLVIFTAPIGLLLGLSFTHFIVQILMSYTSYELSYDLVRTSYGYFVSFIIIGGAIIINAIILDCKINGKLHSQILAKN